MDKNKYFSLVRAPLFGGRLNQTQVDGQIAIIEEGLRRSWPLSWIAYVLATVLHETASTMRWDIREFGRGKGRKYGVPAGPYKLIYYGRSWPQLTWYENYAEWAGRLSVQLDKTPDLMLTAAVATSVTFGGMELGTFTGKRLSDYLPRTGGGSFVGARRIINGQDHAAAIAAYADQFLVALTAADAIAPNLIPAAPPAPTPTTNADTVKDSAAVAGAATGGTGAGVTPAHATDAAIEPWLFWGGLAIASAGLAYLAWRNRRWISVHLSIAAEAVNKVLGKL